MITIALDAMGGDNAPDETIKGAYKAVKERDFHCILVGKESVIQDRIVALGLPSSANISVINANEEVGMSESPTQSYRKKKDSSIQVGLNLVKSGTAHGFVSAGNTGAVMTAATLILGRLSGIERPAIATVFNSGSGKFVMLDMGATVDCKASHLVQFAEMGQCFAENVVGLSEPKIGLLNIGEEAEKGNQLTQEANELFSKAFPNFYGNIEAKEVWKHKADVIVTDGFNGNTLLKFGEGVAELFFNFFRNERKQHIFAWLGTTLMYPSFKRFKKQYDYEETGGAPLLGVNGVTVIAHGSSKAKSIKNALHNALSSVDTNILDKITSAVNK